MPASTAVADRSRPSEARDRLLSTATEIFYADGIRSVGIDRVIAEARVTKATFYRHFPSKEDLVVAYLRSAHEAIRAGVESSVQDEAPVERLRTIAGGVAQDICRPGFRGCAFINAGAEFPDPSSPVRVVVDEHRAWFQQVLVDAFAAAGHDDPQAAADHLVMLRDGAMIRGYLNDPTAASETLVRGVDGIIRVMEEERR